MPRKREQFGVPPDQLLPDSETYRKVERWKPSADLEGEIQALMLKHMKENFRQQSREFPQSKPLGKSKDRERSQRQALNFPRAESDSDDTFRSDGRGEKLTESVNTTARLRDCSSEPAVLINEDEATAVLQPVTRSILSQLDGLLMGLHKSRQGHRHNESRSLSHRRRQSSVSGAGTKRARSRVGKQHIERRLTIKSDPSESGSDSTVEPPQEEERQGFRKGETYKRQRPLNPRDWSEVLGVASLCRWDPEVVSRAARRCESLFGESMTFLDANPPSVNDASDGARADGIEGDPLKVFSAAYLVKGAAVRYYYCPEPDCARQGAHYDKIWRWREHLKRKHTFDNEQIKALEARVESVNLHVGPTTSERSRTPDPAAQQYDCPFLDCAHHGAPFEKAWRWREHLKRVHKYDTDEVKALEASIQADVHQAVNVQGRGSDIGKRKRKGSTTQH